MVWRAVCSESCTYSSVEDERISIYLWTRLSIQLLPPSLLLLLLSALVENGSGTGWVRHLIIKNFECKYSTLVFSNNKKLLNLNLNKKYKKTECKSLIIWNNQNNISKYNKKFISQEERDNINLTNFNKSVLIGCLLSDASIEKNNKWNPRIRFEQSIKYLEYIIYLYNQLSILTGKSKPLLIKRKFRNKTFYSVSFWTRQLKCLTEIFNLFYINVPSSTGKGKDTLNYKKKLNENLYEYFDEVVLAHWIMGDGTKYGKGIILCTDSFSYFDINILINILIIKFNINPMSLDVIYHKSYKPLDKLKENLSLKPRILIRGEEFEKIKYLIKPYILNTFLYKL